MGVESIQQINIATIYTASNLIHQICHLVFKMFHNLVLNSFLLSFFLGLSQPTNQYNRNIKKQKSSKSYQLTSKSTNLRKKNYFKSILNRKELLAPRFLPDCQPGEILTSSEIKTHDNPSHIHWTFIDMYSNEWVWSGGNYALEFYQYDHSKCIKDSSYKFVIYDTSTGGSGLTSRESYYKLLVNGEIIRYVTGPTYFQPYNYYFQRPNPVYPYYFQETIICSINEDCPDDNNVCTIEKCDSTKTVYFFRVVH